jgi:hypothetical protein
MEKEYSFIVIFLFIIGLIILIQGFFLFLGTTDKVTDTVTSQENGMFNALISIIGFIIIALSLYRLFIKKSIFGLNLDVLKDLDRVEEDINASENSEVKKSEDKNNEEKIDIPIVEKDISFKTNKETDNKETDNKETNSNENNANKNIK